MPLIDEIVLYTKMDLSNEDVATKAAEGASEVEQAMTLVKFGNTYQVKDP